MGPWRYNETRNRVCVGFWALLPVLVLLVIAGCASPTPTTPAITTPPLTSPGGGGGTAVNSDSVITAKIQAVRPQSNGYPWEVDILVQSSVDVNSLPNPTKDSVGKVITVKTDQDMSIYKVGDAITGRVKYVGDVPKPGITLYLYNVAPLVAP